MVMMMRFLNEEKLERDQEVLYEESEEFNIIGALIISDIKWCLAEHIATTAG